MASGVKLRVDMESREDLFAMSCEQINAVGKVFVTDPL